jgi:spermidine synthase
MLSTLTLQLRNSEMELHHALRNLKDEMTKTEVSRNTLDILCERRTRARQDAGLQLLDDFNKDIDALITNLVNARTEVLNQELQVEACKSKVEKDRQVCLSAQKTLDCA